MTKRKVMKTNVQSFNEHERISLIHSIKINRGALDYLSQKLKDLEIKFSKGSRKYKGAVIELMNQRVLAGWCWQTTESSIIFLEDDDYIERGYLKFNSSRNYYHSWICFWFENKEFVFDPCLQILIEKFIYYHVFEITEVVGVVKAKIVKNVLLSKLNSDGENYVVLLMSHDVNAPIYLTPIGCTVTTENSSIKTLIVHYTDL